MRLTSYGFNNQFQRLPFSSNFGITSSAQTGADVPVDFGCQRRHGKGCGQILTFHEIRQIHLVITLLDIMIGQDTVVDKLPAKGIGNNDDDPFDRGPFRGRRDICIETV
jgi:hypothetical protein